MAANVLTERNWRQDVLMVRKRVNNGNLLVIIGACKWGDEESEDFLMGFIPLEKCEKRHLSDCSQPHFSSQSLSLTLPSYSQMHLPLWKMMFTIPQSTSVCCFWSSSKIQHQLLQPVLLLPTTAPNSSVCIYLLYKCISLPF